MELLDKLMETSSHAIFTVDQNGILTHINQHAKERFGLFMHSRYSHPAGRLAVGDLVILASTEIGADDGCLCPEDLKNIGIHDKRIRHGGKIVAIGVYQDVTVKPIYKYIRRDTENRLHLDTVYQGVPIHVSIEEEQVVVSIWGMQYSIGYFKCIGQIVVADRLHHRVKFWEENGYSARKEGIGNLLRGASYAAKTPETEICVTGYHFRHFFEGELFEQHLQHLFTQQVPQYINQEYTINGVELMASLYPVASEDQVTDVIVRFHNIGDFKSIILERNNTIRLTEKAYRKAKHMSAQDDTLFSLPGNTASIIEVKRQTNKLAQMGCHILISGEEGTGKTTLARSIAYANTWPGNSNVIELKSEEAFYQRALVCSECPDQLFGPSGGTILVDEIDRLSHACQRQLISIIQDHGPADPNAEKTSSANVRVVATTNRNLKELVEQGDFRADLFYKLSTFSLTLPPLRQCKEDIPFILNSLMDELKRRYGLEEKYLSGEAFDKLISYNWPGNIREIENILERAVVLSDSEIIYADDIKLDAVLPELSLRDQLKQVERQLLHQALLQYNGDRKLAMNKLGLSRSVFYDKLREYGLH